MVQRLELRKKNNVFIIVKVLKVIVCVTVNRSRSTVLFIVFTANILVITYFNIGFFVKSLYYLLLPM